MRPLSRERNCKKSETVYQLDRASKYISYFKFSHYYHFLGENSQSQHPQQKFKGQTICCTQLKASHFQTICCTFSICILLTWQFWLVPFGKLRLIPFQRYKEVLGKNVCFLEKYKELEHFSLVMNLTIC